MNKELFEQKDLDKKIKEFEQLRLAVEEGKKDRARIEGAMAELKNQLSLEIGIIDIEKARTLQKEISSKLKTYDERLDKISTKLKETFEW